MKPMSMRELHEIQRGRALPWKIITLPHIEETQAKRGNPPEIRIAVPGSMVPCVRLGNSIQRNAHENVLILSDGGLGDVVCSEPVLRYAFQAFGCKLSIKTEFQELFAHLPFHGHYTEANKPDWQKFLTFQLHPTEPEMAQDYFVHKDMHCVDFPSMRLLRGTIPDPADKAIRIPLVEPTHEGVREALALGSRGVVCHPGKTWQSRTLPVEWWNAVLREMKARGLVPVIIGKHGTDTSVLDVDVDGCLDLRDKLPLMQFVSLLQHCAAVLSNDSSPIHIAASGNAFIGFVTTVRHPGYLLHWRNGEIGWKTRNFGRDGRWNHTKLWPTKDRMTHISVIPEELMQKILPEPGEVAEYYAGLAG